MMKIKDYVLIILLICFGTSNALLEIEKGLMVLTDGNFDEELKNNELMLVYFYDHMCLHC